MADGSREEEDVLHSQTLKAGLHCTIGQMCEQLTSESGLTFTKQIIAVLTELTYRQLTLCAGDLEAYASHAKRTIVNSEDVKLMVRRNPVLATHIGEMIEKMEEGKKKRGKKRKKQEEEEQERMEEDQID